jgi:hypothetical protein
MERFCRAILFRAVRSEEATVWHRTGLLEVSNEKPPKTLSFETAIECTRNGAVTAIMGSKQQLLELDSVP